MANIVALTRVLVAIAGGLAGLAAATAQAQTIGLPRGPGVYATLGGGGQGSEAPGVAAFGDLSSSQAGNLGGAAAESLSFASGGNSAGAASGAATANPGEGSAAAGAARDDAVGAGAASASGNGGGTGSASASIVGGANPAVFVATQANGGNVNTANSSGPGPQTAAAASAASPNGSAAASASPNGGRFVDAGSGTWFGGAIGYSFRLGDGVTGAVEAYGSQIRSDDNTGVQGAAGFRSVNNETAFAAASAPLANLTTMAEQEVRLSEIGVRLKAGNPNGALPLIVGLEPFYISYEQDTETSSAGSGNFVVGGLSARRNADVEGRLYGAQAALETQVPLFGQSIFWLARGSGGFYRVEADGDFSSDIFVPSFGFGASARVHDKDSDWGYRAGAETGVRIVFNPSLALSLTGGVDYLSDVPTAVLPRSGSDGPAHIEMDDLTTWKFGAQLTFSFATL